MAAFFVNGESGRWKIELPRFVPGNLLAGPFGDRLTIPRDALSSLRMMTARKRECMGRFLNSSGEQGI